MARVFSRTSSEYLYRDAPIKTSEPFTMACWVKITEETVADTMTVMSINRIADDSRHTLKVGSDKRAYVTTNNRWTSGSGVPLLITNTWHHICGVWVSSGERSLYVDGQYKKTNSVPETVVPQHTAIGAYKWGSTYYEYFEGIIAYPTFWGVALSSSEIAELADYKNPQNIQPSNILAFYPLTSSSNGEDAVNSFHMTLKGTTYTSDEPFRLGGAGSQKVHQIAYNYKNVLYIANS